MYSINRPLLKKNAKTALQGNWAMAIAILLIYCIISAVINFIAKLPFLDVINIKTYFYYLYNNIPFEWPLHIAGLSFVTSIISVALLSPVFIGFYAVFLKISRHQHFELSDLFRHFPYFLKTAGLVLLITLKTFLWSLLFIVPGIIAMYRYAMAYYIMAENPQVGIVEAIELSKQMMHGNKGALLVLHLSFFGWMLLVPLTLGIFYLWLTPYMQTTCAYFYNAVSAQFLDAKRKILSDSDDNDGFKDFY